jgi:hypothetical protein
VTIHTVKVMRTMDGPGIMHLPEHYNDETKQAERRPDGSAKGAARTAKRTTELARATLRFARVP